MELSALVAKQFRLYSFDHYGSDCVALKLSNRKPRTPTKFCLMLTRDAIRWYRSSSNAGSLYWSPVNKAVVHNYDDPDAPKGVSIILLSRFVTKAPGGTYCTSTVKQPLDLRPDKWKVYEHKKGNPLTAAEQLEAKAKREHGREPYVTLLSRLVEPNKLDWNTWTVRP